MVNLFLEHLAAPQNATLLQSQHVLVAVSGGADSVALLRGLRELAPAWNLQLSVAHLNHQLRAQAIDDARWIEEMCRELEIPAIIGTRDVPAIARQNGAGIEETARKVRYTFLEETARKHTCTLVATAHSANDQTETILHHLIRGSGLRGLCGISRSRILAEGLVLVRPMLDANRGQVEGYLAQIGQSFRTDLSNFDETYTRNRIRHNLIPLLESQYNPQFTQAILRLSRQAAETNQALETIAQRMLDEATVDDASRTVRLDCSVFADHPSHLIRECLVQLWRRKSWPRKKMGFAHWDRLADLIVNPGDLNLPGPIRARRRGQLLIIDSNGLR